MNLCQAVDAYIDGRHARGELVAKSVNSIRGRLASLVNSAGADLEVAQLSRAHIDTWQRQIGQSRPATRRAYLSTVRVFCRWAVLEGHLAVDPTLGAARIREPRREPRALSAGALSRLELVLPDLRARVIVGLMCSVGLRCVEVARLRFADYDPAAGTVLVVGKAGDERLLPLPEATAVLLARWAATRSTAPAEPIIGLSAQRLSVLVSRYMAAAGLKAGRYDGVSAHALRHTFASDTLDRCGNVRTVQDALGHLSLATTQRYLRTTTLEQLRAAMTPSEPPASAIPSE